MYIIFSYHITILRSSPNLGIMTSQSSTLEADVQNENALSICKSTMRLGIVEGELTTALDWHSQHVRKYFLNRYAGWALESI